MTSAATFTHLDVSTIGNNKPEENTDTRISTIGIVHSIIASVGVVTNLTVVVVFLNHRKLRRKVPNICIINQVRFISPLCRQWSSVNNCNNIRKVILKPIAHDFKLIKPCEAEVETKLTKLSVLTSNLPKRSGRNKTYIQWVLILLHLLLIKRLTGVSTYARVRIPLGCILSSGPH